MPKLESLKQYVVSYPALVVCFIEYSASIYCAEVSVVVAIVVEASFTALFGVRNVTFSLVTPPLATAIFVVSPASERFVVVAIFHAPPVTPTSVHEPTALQVVIFVPYSRRSAVDADVTAPSFETWRRTRTGVV